MNCIDSLLQIAARRGHPVRVRMININLRVVLQVFVLVLVLYQVRAVMPTRPQCACVSLYLRRSIRSGPACRKQPPIKAPESPKGLHGVRLQGITAQPIAVVTWAVMLWSTVDPYVDMAQCPDTASR